MHVGDECDVGSVLGWIFEDLAEYREFQLRWPDSGADRPASGQAALIITEPARALIDQHGIDDDRIRSIGSTLITSARIQELLAPGPPASGKTTQAGDGGLALDQNQRAVAAVVTESHRTIPCAFTAMRIYIDEALRYCADVAARAQVFAGLPELLVKIVAGQYRAFPVMFTGLRPDGTFPIPATADVGVTVDIGTGLFVPVIRRADILSLAAIADALLGFRTAAITRSFRATDLAPGNILVALNNDTDVIVAEPMVFPGHSCALSLGGQFHDVSLDNSGGATVRQYVSIGIAYDHRIVNGRDATRFLGRIKKTLEAPDRLRAAVGEPTAPAAADQQEDREE
jgi:2-oxoglutarate dehydrogenase E2 component (dihydrolipoamide succinyltransferase)